MSFVVILAFLCPLRGKWLEFQVILCPVAGILAVAWGMDHYEQYVALFPGHFEFTILYFVVKTKQTERYVPKTFRLVCFRLLFSRPSYASFRREVSSFRRGK